MADRLWVWPLGGSVVAHGLALGWLLASGGRAMPAEPPPVEVELVQETSQERGAPPQAQVAEVPATPTAPPTPPVPALPTGDGLQAATPAPAPPPSPGSPASPSKQARPAVPEVNLGTSPEDIVALNATSQDIKPATPDSRYRNLPPPYPIEAARSRAEGTVQLLIHVSPAGLPSEVSVVHSSGAQSLDAAAKRALSQWRFKPARQGGRAVGFDYVINLRFTLGAQ